MLVQGTKFWNDRDRFYSQFNNPTESLLHSVLPGGHGWLESCGPTSAINCLASLGHNINITCPGTYMPQPEEVLMDYLNDPRNRSEMLSIIEFDKNTPPNRIAQVYPLAVGKVFGVSAYFNENYVLSDIVNLLCNGKAIQLCFVNPGHYVAAVAYDLGSHEIIYNDSWGERFSDGKGGFNRRLSVYEFLKNVKCRFVVYS